MSALRSSVWLMTFSGGWTPVCPDGSARCNFDEGHAGPHEREAPPPVKPTLTTSTDTGTPPTLLLHSKSAHLLPGGRFLKLSPPGRFFYVPCLWYGRLPG